MSKSILMIAGDYTEDYEVMVPFQALQITGLNVDVVCPDKVAGDTIQTAVHDFGDEQTYSEKPGHKFALNSSFDYLDLSKYDGLYLTGGRSPEYLRTNPRILDIVRYFFQLNLPVAAICHGVQILCSAGVLQGRTLTCYYTVEHEVKSAGGNYIKVDPSCAVVDKNLVTSPAWPGHVEIIKEYVKLLGVEIFVK